MAQFLTAMKDLDPSNIKNKKIEVGKIVKILKHHNRGNPKENREKAIGMMVAFLSPDLTNISNLGKINPIQQRSVHIAA
jgi:hypothetical protein